MNARQLLLPEPDFYDTDSFEDFKSRALMYFASVRRNDLMEWLRDQDFNKARWHAGGGFFVFYLSNTNTRPEGQLRVHVWPEAVMREYTDVHLHPWHLASLVVHGTYSERIAELISNGDETKYTLYDSFQNPDNPSDYTIAPLAPAFFRFSQPQKYETGFIHCLEKRRYHLTSFSNFVVTLCVMGKSEIDASFARHKDFSELMRPSHETMRKQLGTLP